MNEHNELPPLIAKSNKNLSPVLDITLPTRDQYEDWFEDAKGEWMNYSDY